MALHRVQRRDAGRGGLQRRAARRRSSACRSCGAFAPALRRARRCRRGTACCTRCSTRTRQWARTARAAADRDPRLARGADPQRVRALPGLLPTAMGIECVIADPRELEYRGGRLYGPGDRVDLIYKRVLIARAGRARAGWTRPMVRAVRDRAVCMVNPFRCKMLHKKASLAVLSDERNARALQRRGARGDRRAHSVDARRGGAADRASRAAEVDLVPFIVARPGAARAQAQRRLRRQGHRARLGRWTHATWEAGGGGRAREPLHRAGAGRAARRAVPERGGRAA